MLFCIFSNVLVYFSIQSNESLSRVQLFATPWTVAHQAPTSMGFSRQEYWSGLLYPLPGDLPNLGIKPISPVSPASQSDYLPLSHLGSPTISWITPKPWQVNT